MHDLSVPRHAHDRVPAVSSSCQVLLDELEVMADIGALASERGVPQPLRIQVALAVVPPSRDDISQTFDYCRIRAFALELASERIVLIETFAQRLAQMCLASDLVLDAEVLIHKPRAIPGCLAGTRVRLSKDQDRRAGLDRR